jgi:hypothetical protein
VYSRRGRQRWPIAILVAAVVFSHWLLDALVHCPELPLAGAASRAVGAGLWSHMPVAMAVEAALVGLGMVLYFPGSGLARGKAIALAALSLVALAFTGA